MQTKSKLLLRRPQLTILLGIILAFVTFSALYRTSSQGDFSETYPKGFRGGACTIETNTLTIGYSGYYLPLDYEIPKDTIRSAYVPIQCGRVPEPASLNISIDLLYPETARNFLLSQRLVKSELINEQKKEIDILTIPATQHPSGVITQAIKLTEPGQYTLYIEGKNDQDVAIQLMVPLKVGFGWKDHFKTLFSTFLPKD